MILRASRSGPARRSGFTLLEILLASIIAAMVLAAVYMLLNVTLQQTQTSRDAVESEDLSRGIFNKMTVDLSGTLTPLPPKSGGNNAASGGTTAPSTTPTDPAAPADPSGMPAAPGSTAPADPNAAAATPTDDTTPGAIDNATAAAADFAFQGGVIGEEKKLVIYAGKIPEAYGRYGNPGPQLLSDQRQIIYWLGGNGGLYRRERPWVTADGVRNAVESDEEALDSRLLAEEVVDLFFEYFDGESWIGTWDGTVPGPDGVTPLGPPRAIRVTLMLQVPISRGEVVTKQVSHVIAVRSAPGTYTPPLLDAPTDGGDNPTTDPTTGGTTGGNMGGTTGGSTGGNMGGTTGGTTPSPGGTTPSPGGMRAGGSRTGGKQ